MSKKSFDQRLKEKWLRKQREENAQRSASMSEFRRMNEMVDSVAAYVLPVLFRRRNR